MSFLQFILTTMFLVIAIPASFVILKELFEENKRHPELRKISGEEIKIESGYGQCGICGDSWRWKERHYLPMPDGSGIFPYCEECHNTKSKKQKHEAIEKLRQEWISMIPLTEDDVAKIDEAHRIVEAEYEKH